MAAKAYRLLRAVLTTAVEDGLIAMNPCQIREAARNHQLLTWGRLLERVTRIELALSAWEADVLPLNYTRDGATGAS
jgi:hypothetical protein